MRDQPADREVWLDEDEIDAASQRGGAPLALLLVLGLAVVASAGLVLYGMFVDRSRTQVPILVSGFIVLGLTFVGLAFICVASAIRAGRRGRGGRALFLAILGGLFCLAAAANLGAGVVLALLYGSTPGA